MSIQDFKKRIPQVIFENPDELISGGEHQKLLLDGVDLVEAELNKKADSKDVKTELDKKVDNTSFDEYKKEQGRVNDTKVDKVDYKADLEVQKEIDENQDKRIDDNSIKISESNQELKVIKDTLKHLGSNDEIEVATGGSIISLPNNAMKSVAPSYKINGLTLNQLVKNCNFKDNYTHWIMSNIDFAIIDGVFRFKAIEKLGWVSQKLYGLYDNDLIYYNIKAKVETENVHVYFGFNSKLTKKIPKSLNLITVSDIIGVDTHNNTSFGIRDFNDSNFGYVYIDYISAINLTKTFGKGNEPSKEWCDEHISGYFEGVKSVQTPMRVKSQLGNDNLLKNSGYFDISEANHWSFSAYNELISKENNIATFKNKSTSSTRIERIIMMPKGIYTVSIKSKDSNFNFYNFENADILDKGIEDSGVSWAVFKFFGGSTRIRAYYNHPVDATFNVEYFKLEKGDKATAWMPSIKDPVIDDYRNIMYINNQLELKSVGNTKDYIEDGKLYQNTKRYYFTKEDEWTLREYYEGDNFRYSMLLPFEYKTTGSEVEGELICNNFTPTSNVEGAMSERESNTIALYKENDSIVYLTLDKKIDDVNSAIPEGTFIDVILPETEVTNLNTSGLITNHPNGTIFIEPITNVTAYYNDGLDVSSINIEEVVEFSHMIDGAYEPLDVSKVEIKDNKLTHPDANNGLVYLVYRYDANPIFGNNEVSYYNNNRVLESPNGTFFKPVFSVDDEGNITMKGEKL